MFDIQEELKRLPEKPGVYIMKDVNNEIIYVGKAVVLKNRVRQYFQSLSNQTPKVAAMVPRIKEFEYIVTDSELEALILECNLIKKHRPKFNILMKDDKHYPFIKVTMNEDYPRILMTRRMDKDGARYFGPYSNTTAVNETIDLIKKLFPIKSCKKEFPRDIGKERPCLNYHISQCLGPCTGAVDKEKYLALMKDICNFLGGKQEEIVKRMEEEMKAASENMDFERAAALRDKIGSLRHIAEKQKVLSTATGDQDIIAFAKDRNDSCVQVFFIRGGKLIGREHFIFEETGGVEDKELMSSFIKQFYGTTAFVPGEIILQEDIDEINIIERWLSEKRDARVHIRVPRRGEKHQLVEMVSKNALIALQQFEEKSRYEDSAALVGLHGLKALLGLMKTTDRIEAYDISNTGASDIVASMVVYENGKPCNKEYRRFRIKSLDTQNDYQSMQEVVYRRFRHAEKERDDYKAKFSKMPDLILLDGGIGHVNSVSETLKGISVDIPVYGMVKDSNHRTRALVFQGGEIDLKGHPPVFRLITNIQDEAHRFALDYNKKLREKRYRISVLDEIDGIGTKERRHFSNTSDQ